MRPPTAASSRASAREELGRRDGRDELAEVLEAEDEPVRLAAEHLDDVSLALDERQRGAREDLVLVLDGQSIS
jgi:hypothetical protein